MLYGAGERMEHLIWSLLDNCLGFEDLQSAEFESFASALGQPSGSWLVGEGESEPPLRRRSLGGSGGGDGGRYARGFQAAVNGYAGGQEWLRGRQVPGWKKSPEPAATAAGAKTAGGGSAGGGSGDAGGGSGPDAAAAAAAAAAVPGGARGGGGGGRTMRGWPFRDSLPTLRAEISALTGGWDTAAAAALRAVREKGVRSIATQ